MKPAHTEPMNMFGTSVRELSGAQKKRAALAGDRHRPSYHFLPPAHWMNDPNGFIQWGDEHHLFYQHNPNEPDWGDIHWGHAVSKDLVYWTDLPIALLPTVGTPDEGGCFSGCAVDDGGTPTLLYTGFVNDEQAQCLATSRDQLVTWQPDPNNPILAGAPLEMRAEDFRDPFVWREAAIWYMVLGTGKKTGGGAALLYRSKDLRKWEYLHPLLEGRLEETGEVWECPNFFPLGDKYVLIVSVWPRAFVHYFIGSYENYRFTPETSGRLDHNGSFYAPLSTLDHQGRRLLVGWLDEWRSLEARKRAGWAGVLSLPQTLALTAEAKLLVQPAAELEVLRGEYYTLPGNAFTGLELRGDALEIIVKLKSSTTQRYGISVLCSPNREEETHIYYEAKEKRLIVDRARASLDPEVSREPHIAMLELAPDEALVLRVFVDRSVIEVFANNRAFIASRVYPTRSDSLEVALMLDEGVTVQSLEAWQMKTIW